MARTGMCYISSLGTSECHLNSAATYSPRFVALVIFSHSRALSSTIQYIISSAARFVSILRWQTQHQTKSHRYDTLKSWKGAERLR
jgi:hypothetical protein